MSWSVFSYQTSLKQFSVEEFILKLDQPTQIKISRLIDYLENNGPFARMPHSKQIGANLYELRIKGKQEVRIFYCFISQKIYLLHGILKKTNKTPYKDLKIARSRLKELQ